MRAKDFEDGTVMRLKIEEVRQEQVMDKVRAVLYFCNIELGFVLNITNRQSLVNLFGDDPTNLEGEEIILYRTKDTLNGCIPIVRTLC